MPDDEQVQTEEAGQPEAPDFREYIPENMREAKYWENVPDLPTLVKNYGEQQKYIGSSIRLPGDDAPPEEWGRIYSKLGRPDSADAYELPDPGEGLAYNEQVLDPLRSKAHTLGLSNKQFAGMAEAVLEVENEQQKARQASYNEVTQALQEEWGPSYDSRVGLANRAALMLFGEDVLDAIDQAGIGNLKGFVKGMARIGEQYAEDGILPNVSEGEESPSDALEKANELMQDPAYLDPKDPRHQSLQRQVEDFFKRAYPPEI